MQQQPFGFGHLLCAVDLLLSTPKEIVIIGKLDDPGTMELVRGANRFYLPNRVLQVLGPDEPLEQRAPLLNGKKQLDNKPTAYVCQNYTCSAPVVSRPDLEKLLQA